MKLTKTKIVLILVVLSLVFVVLPTQARVGVGVGSGKIEVNGVLKAGGIYDLPTLPVINTGDEPLDYEVSVDFRDTQKELKPDAKWIKFDPDSFYLEPGQVKNVTVTLVLPVKTEPGKYFCFLSAHPVMKAASGGATSVGVAAASKLYFEVTPGNIFQGIYFRLASLYKDYKVFLFIILGLVVAFILFKILKKYIHLEIGIKK